MLRLIFENHNHSLYLPTVFSILGELCKIISDSCTGSVLGQIYAGFVFLTVLTLAGPSIFPVQYKRGSTQPLTILTFVRVSDEHIRDRISQEV